VTSYIESAAGVAAGARTGLGNLVIAGLFVVAMFCAPIVAIPPSPPPLRSSWWER